jgi:polar amino acid transport system substrate-binding protein
MTSSRTRGTSLVAAFAIGALTLTACGDDGDNGANGGNGDGDAASPEAGGTLAEIQEEGTVVVGIAGEEPYSYTDENGELTGATIALHREIFGNLGIENVEGTLVDWDALIPGLNANRFDVISAGMSILPERCEQADFGDPEIMYTTALLVPEGNPDDLHSMQDVAESDVTFAAMSGAIEQGYADALGIETMIVNSPQDGLDAVVSGRADVYALTGISLRAMVENNPDAPVEVTDSFVAVVDGVEQVGAGATVFRKGDEELREAYNEELAKIVDDPAEYERVLGPFGFTEAERPPEDITTEQLCAGELPSADDSAETTNR